MAPKNSGHRGDDHRDRTRSHTVKNQHPSSQSSNNAASNNTRPAPHNAHATISNTTINPQLLNSQTLHQHTTHQVQLSQNPHHARIIRQNESRRLQESFYSLGVDVPCDFYPKNISRTYQSQAYTPIPIPTETYTSTQAYSTQYLAPESTISYMQQPTDDDHTWIETRDERDINEQDIRVSSNDFNGIGGQFPVYSHQTPRYTHSIYQMEADMRHGS
ncbi:hypothetical protein NHQ30_011103 [Ciborinia camelliae]|nr:hypothetical protein NHQ30_011103 [Ciborinia camelliae]